MQQTKSSPLSSAASALLWQTPRTDFGPAPPGYVPGIGRGAVGFTTRSDIGPAKPMEEQQVIGRSRQLPIPPLPNVTLELDEAKQSAREAATYSDANYDDFGGYSEGLFASGSYTNEDREADELYSAIDRRVKGKKRKKFADTSSDLNNDNKNRANNKSASAQFLDLKRDLVSVGSADWDSIPDPLDYSQRNAMKKKSLKLDKLTPVPDSIIMAASSAIQSVGNDKQSAIINNSSVIDDLTSVGRARDAMMGIKLDRVSDSSTGHSDFSSVNYLTDLDAMKINSSNEISDIKKARKLLFSIIETNPKSSQGYISLARLEVATGNILAARKIILSGCQNCSQNSDIWLEAASLHAGESAKSIMAQAVNARPGEEIIWSRAANLEEKVENKKSILRAALEILPKSSTLWKSLIELENEEDAKILLFRAVELIPDNSDFWLALIKLANYSEAKIILNRARKNLPHELNFWLTAAKLEEKHGNKINVKKIIEKAEKNFNQMGKKIERNEWITQATKAEKEGAEETCRAIIKTAISSELSSASSDDWPRDSLLGELGEIISLGNILTCRAIFENLLENFPSDSELWLKFVNFERVHGSSATLISVLSSSLVPCPNEEIFWLMLAKQIWISESAESARNILIRAQNINPDSEQICLAAVKIEMEIGDFARARNILDEAKNSSTRKTEKIFIKSAKLERIKKEKEKEIRDIDSGLKLFPSSYKLWLMKLQWAEKHQKENFQQIREIYKLAVKNCSKSEKIWTSYANFEAEIGENKLAAISRARAILEAAKKKMPKNDFLWLETLKMQTREENFKNPPNNSPMLSAMANQILAKALQLCPRSGLLWAYSIEHEARTGRRQKIFDALSQCQEDEEIYLAIAKTFWAENKFDKSREWFEKSVQLNPLNGDCWAFYFKFAEQQKLEEENFLSSLISRCVQSAPSEGLLWRAVSKADQFVKFDPRAILLECAARIHQILPGEKIPHKSS